MRKIGRKSPLRNQERACGGEGALTSVRQDPEEESLEPADDGSSTSDAEEEVRDSQRGVITPGITLELVRLNAFSG